MLKKLCAFVLGALLLAVNSHATQQSGDMSHPVLVNSCVVTAHLKELVEFYQRALLLEPRALSDQYAEFATGVGVLALFSDQAQERYIPGSARAEQNRSVILEFRVANVDREYQRLRRVVKTWVKGPTTQPWGTRSIYFRDPDGNLVNFWMPVSKR